MKALTAAEMREVDRLTTERYGMSSLQLMENAGRKVAEAVLRAIEGRENVRVCVLCGRGNNGGDGFVVARLLREAKLWTQVLLFGERADVRGDAAANLSKWMDSGGIVETVLTDPDWEKIWPQVCSSNIIVDAMLGTGLRGGASGRVGRAISDLNEHSKNGTSTWPALILAVDTPSGLPSDGDVPAGPVLVAHRTVTFTSPKIGQLTADKAEACGALEVADIGSPSVLVEEIGKQNLRWIGSDEFESLPLVRAADSHKGTFGHAVIVAGSRGKSGAAVLAGYACLRAGAGLTTIATPDDVQPAVAAAHAEYMTEALLATKTGGIAAANSSSGRMAKILEGKSVVAVGPGIGTHVETRMVVQQLVRETTLPIVLDADGLNCFDGEADKLARRKTQYLAITPHPGEMAKLLGIKNSGVQSERLKVAADAAKRWNLYVILKGFHTILAAPDGRTLVNKSGGPALAKGGSGDVLTGVLAALTAQFGTEDWLRVLALGVFLHGAAADILARKGEPSGVLAHEVAQNIPAARESLLREIRFGA
ncbi:MAG TPA: NAD(P)H-hydrate dehydratase [Candidatus Solibacter sp.]|nr:NAD(P)H-hydrate dehydratase [Candidatus Solibacter sp.]